MDKKKIEVDIDVPSKGKIAFAWFMLFILFGMAFGLYYLKNFYNRDKIENAVVETQSNVIEKELTKIVNNFNESDIVSNYKNDGYILNASLSDDTIIVSYKVGDDSGKVEYSYILSLSSLSSNGLSSNKEINDKIFKALVYACQVRINNGYDHVLDKVDLFIDNKLEIDGLSIISDNDKITYSINIVKEIEDSSDNSSNDIIDDNNENKEGE